jgi:hypothetical protein
MNKKNLIGTGLVGLGILAFTILGYNYYLMSPRHHFAGTDKFGIKEIYPTEAGGEEWFMNMNNPAGDSRIGGEGPKTTFVQQNEDGSWKVQSTEVRLGVLTSAGYHPNLITSLNQRALASQGYIQSPSDWKNVEMTGYFKVNSFTQSTQNGPAHIELVARGGRNTHNIGTIGGLSRQCEATTYHSNTYVDGRVKFEKDLEHTIGYTTNDPEKLHVVSPLVGQWIGIKAVFYNLKDGHSVKLEQWISDNNDNWHRVLSYVDYGQWGGGDPNCGGADNQIITWGGPIAIFRWDNIDDMDVKDFSVREINPPN